jgi:16S rRNA (guanine527-N7)-methyltransferase
VITAVPRPERERPDIRAAIAAAFGDRAGLAETYADYLCTAGIERGLLGPHEADRVWERHILNCTALSTLIPPAARVVDLGSGAGLPGIPLAISRPDIEMVLLEPLQRRVQFLADCCELLSLPNLSVHRGRAAAGLPKPADVVVARAVASLEKLLGLSAHLLVDNGTLLALKGATAADEVEQMRENGAGEMELLSVPAPGRAAVVVRVTVRRPATRASGSKGRR